MPSLRSCGLGSLLSGALLSGALLTGVLLTGALAAEEPSPAHLDAARQLVVASGASGGVDSILPALIADIRRQALTRPDIAKDLDEVLKNLAPELEQQRQQAMTIAARAYAKFLSEGEIKDAVAFFKSPAGMKYSAVQADVTDDLISSVTAWSQLAAEYLQARVRSEMLKRGHQIQ